MAAPLQVFNTRSKADHARVALADTALCKRVAEEVGQQRHRDPLIALVCWGKLDATPERIARAMSCDPVWFKHQLADARELIVKDGSFNRAFHRIRAALSPATDH